MYVAEFPVFQQDERKQLNSFVERMSWPKVNDVEKLLLEIRSLRSEQPNVPSRLRKFNPNLQIEHSKSEEFQITLRHVCNDQDWDDIAMVTVDGMGRGVIALKHFKKGDVILDYHGSEVPFEEYRDVHEYCEEKPDSRMPEYCIEIVRGKRRLIDATLEPCPCHPGRSCFGRLCNHANENSPYCNIRMVEVKADKLYGLKEHWRRVVFVAKRDIEPLEQLMFDYGDENARRIF